MRLIQLINSAMNLIEFQIQRATQQHAIHRIDVKDAGY